VVGVDAHRVQPALAKRPRAPRRDRSSEPRIRAASRGFAPRAAGFAPRSRGRRIAVPSATMGFPRTVDGRFVLDAEAAAGGMGTVYRGHDAATGAPLAIKVLHRTGSADHERFL